MHSSWIGTHDGKFHCDEVFACYMLKKLPRFAEHIIVRTRDPEILAKCDVVVDVGGVYDHRSKRYDHHQRGFTDTMKTLTGLDFTTKLSSAGLVYAHYGRQLLAQIMGISDTTNADLLKIYEKLYKTFVESIDAIDNGIEQYDEGTPKYQLASTLTSRVHYCNPAWNDESPDPEKCFSRAREIVAEEFESRVHHFFRSWLPARRFVEEAILTREKSHPSGKILVLENGGLPWKEHFFDLESEKSLEKEDICLIVYSDESGKWRVQAIPVSEISGFENRISIPWKGLRDKELEEQSGITGAIFVHINGFIGGTKTRYGAMVMAERTLEEAKKWQSATKEEEGADQEMDETELI